jgi:uncharacterized protein with NAD-binding domain and iron-sulfur cluster
MPDAAEPVKVAVLGGGPAALAAAFELTEPGLGGRYDVTVYHPGWRLGGKCASGRNRARNDRIEEHGLHVWFGFYENAFRLIQRCYDELGRPASAPLATWQDAFHECNDIVLFEHWRDRWIPWHIQIPPDDGIPGTPSELTVWDFLHRVLRWLLDERKLAGEDGVPAPTADPEHAGWLGWLGDAADGIGERLEDLTQAAAENVLELACKLARVRAQDPGRPDGDGLLEWIGEVLAHAKRRCLDDIVDEALEEDHLRRYFMMVDFWEAVVSGIIADDLYGRGFGAVNDEDLRDWLKRHGANEVTLDQAPFLKGLYDLVFAYRDGDKAQADLAAGKALQAMIRIVAGYQGAMLWEMQAGMGDTIFGPLYEVLRCRGVKFAFFHWVTRLGVTADGRAVDTIEVIRQTEPVGGAYKPLFCVNGLACWPSEPDWDALLDGAELRDRGVNLEREPNPLGRPPVTLRRGQDFDEVVLGIPVGALPGICGELAERNPRFRAMLDNAHTVVTQGVQLWLDRDAATLGWPYGEQSITSAYVDRLDTYSSMSHLIEREDWPAAGRPREIAYLCGVVRHEGLDTQEQADARVRDNALRFLQEDVGPLWPAAPSGDSTCVDWDRLVDLSGATGDARLDAQFARANFQPGERYVLTPAGSVAHRLRADQSGFANLALAGDWTRNGIDGGSVEAAVTSGMQAARAISGFPASIAGETGWLVDD